MSFGVGGAEVLVSLLEKLMRIVYKHAQINEMVEHWAFKKGRVLQADEIDALKEKLVLDAGHLWIRDTAQVMMCWWKRDG
jgi:hypothetical protein